MILLLFKKLLCANIDDVNIELEKALIKAENFVSSAIKFTFEVKSQPREGILFEGFLKNCATQYS